MLGTQPIGRRARPRLWLPVEGHGRRPVRRAGQAQHQGRCRCSPRGEESPHAEQDVLDSRAMALMLHTWPRHHHRGTGSRRHDTRQLRSSSTVQYLSPDGIVTGNAFIPVTPLARGQHAATSTSTPETRLPAADHPQEAPQGATPEEPRRRRILLRTYVSLRERRGTAGRGGPGNGRRSPDRATARPGSAVPDRARTPPGQTTGCWTLPGLSRPMTWRPRNGDLHAPVPR